MNDAWVPAFLAVAVSIGGSLLAWIIADSKAKAALAFLTDAVGSLEEKQDALAKTVVEKIVSAEAKISRLEQDRGEMLRMIERLDNLKASKEIVDQFKTEISNLRGDLDRRFDKLERLLGGGGHQV